MRVYFYRLAAGVVCFCLVFVVSPGSAEQKLSSWLASADPAFTVVDPDIPPTLIPPGNRDCTPETKFVITPRNILKGQAEVSSNYCAVQTAYGLQATSDGYLTLPETGIAGRLKNRSGGNLVPVPVPRSQSLLFLTGGFDGSNVNIVRNFRENMTANTQPDGSVHYLLKQDAAIEIIKDERGVFLSFADQRFSANGKWMLGDVPNRGMARVNIETGQTLIFGQPFRYNVGLNPHFITSISSDGRYAFVGEATYQLFRLYDLSACAQTCPYKDLFPVFRNKIPGFKGVAHAQFSSVHTLRLHVGYTGPDNSHKTAYYSVTAAGETEAGMDYLAMGDSFTSGEGAYNYKPYTDVRSPLNKCHLSLFSYPYLLAGRTNLNISESVACSGAKIKDINYPDEADYAQRLKQADGREKFEIFDMEIYRDYLVGYRTQMSFNAVKNPKIVTLSISGNDIGFGGILASCLMPGTCYSTPQEKVDLAHTINSKFEALITLFGQTKSNAAAGARIYIIGYPLMTEPGGNCALNVHLDKQELQLANQIVVQLNKVISKAAEKSGVKYISIENALDGYRLCENKNKETSVNGLTAGDDKTFSIPLAPVGKEMDLNLTGRESYHPNQLGHQLIADAIAWATRGFEERNPVSAPATQAPTTEATNLTGVNINNLQPRRLIFDDSLSGNLIFKDRVNKIFASGFLPQSISLIELRGEKPQLLPSAATNSKGELATNIQAPPTTPAGFYVLSAKGKNIAGEEISVQKTVYVAASETDIDGDGVPNELEGCLAVQGAGQDIDLDSADDACDPLIGEPPVKVTKNSPEILIERNTNKRESTLTLQAPDNLPSQPITLENVTLGATHTNSATPKRYLNPLNSKLEKIFPLAAVLFPAAVLSGLFVWWALHWLRANK